MYTDDRLVQKSKEKNLGMEEGRRRMEASMRRKHQPTQQVNAGAGTGADDSGSSSPTSTGAMDSLLEKLRAAAPQARDQRDRRRRARLKERHQTRVASGQRIPDLTEIASGEASGGSVDLDNTALNGLSSSAQSPTHGEDVADRAASMLQGLRRDGGEGDAEEGGHEPDEQDAAAARASSMRVRRRRESADDERRARRSRRGVATKSSEGGGPLTTTTTLGEEAIPEVGPGDENGGGSGGDGDGDGDGSGGGGGGDSNGEGEGDGRNGLVESATRDTSRQPDGGAP